MKRLLPIILTLANVALFLNARAYALNCADYLNSPSLSLIPIDYVKMYPEAKNFSNSAHEGQMYVFDIPFRDHLSAVESVLSRHGFSRETQNGAKLFILARLHDVVEDVPTVSFHEIEFRFGSEIARMVRAVTSNQKLPRLEGFAEIFPLLRAEPLALVVKLADRIANVEAGIIIATQTGNDQYIQNALNEFPIFKRELYKEGSLAEPLWRELENTLKEYSLDQLWRSQR